MKKSLIVFLKAVRAPFFAASLIPIFVGVALASREGFYQIPALIFAVIIVFSSHAGSNLLNDYFDALGSDLINTKCTPFSGGSRVIQNGWMSRQTVLRLAILSYAICLSTACYLSVVYGNWNIFGLATLGALIGISYSGTIVVGMARGWGELMIGASFGPLSVMGSFLLQTGYISQESFLAGIPVGFLIMGVLILNEFPDIEADEASGKRNWIVCLGIKRGVWVYLSTLTAAYLSLLVGVLANIFPSSILYSYLTIPLAIWVSLRLWRYRNRVPEIIPAMAGNIGLHIITGLLIGLGLWK